MMTRRKVSQWRETALLVLDGLEFILVAMLVGALFVAQSVAGFVRGRE